MAKSIWILLVVSMFVGVGVYAEEGQSEGKKKEGGCGCGKPPKGK